MVNEDDDDNFRDAEISDLLSQDDVMALAIAVRRGDRVEAELMLDRIVGDDVRASEWVQQARFSNNARPQPVRLAKAA
jgi:hypothetical protein